MGQLPAGDWISVAEAAEILGVGKRRALQFVKANRLPGRLVGNAHLVRRADAARLAKEPRRPGPKPK